MIGGLTLTALRQKSSIPRMMTMLPLLLLLMKLLLKLRLLIKELLEVIVWLDRLIIGYKNNVLFI